jgi:hypothetical protein
MKHLIKYLIAVILIFIAGFTLTSSQPVKADNKLTGDPDTANIAIVEYTVNGMDSISVDHVQDILDATDGVVFNFACWSDTVVFIEYDSLLTDKYQLMDVIKDMGYRPKIRSGN